MAPKKASLPPKFLHRPLTEYMIKVPVGMALTPKQLSQFPTVAEVNRLRQTAGEGDKGDKGGKGGKEGKGEKRGLDASAGSSHDHNKGAPAGKMPKTWLKLSGERAQNPGDVDGEQNPVQPVKDEQNPDDGVDKGDGEQTNTTAHERDKVVSTQTMLF